MNPPAANAAAAQQLRADDVGKGNPRSTNGSGFPAVDMPQPLEGHPHPNGNGGEQHDLNRFTGSPIPKRAAPGVRSLQSAGAAAAAAAAEEEEEALIREQLSRNISFLGEAEVQKMRNAFVIIVGAGGVGSHAAHMLLRAGIGKLRLIDFDQVSLSSLNRHAVANRFDVGTPKVVAMRKHFNRIFPMTLIDLRVELFDKTNADHLLGGRPDFVLDCIDNMTTKVDLMAYCFDRNIKIISSMGAGARADPTAISIVDISQTLSDPFAKTVRIRLMKEYKISQGIPCVFTSERPRAKLLPVADEEDAHDFAALPNFRSRILPVLGTLPSIFGIMMANHVICDVSGFGNSPLFVRNQVKEWQDLYIKLTLRQLERTGSQKVAVDKREVGYLHDEVFHGRSVLSGNMVKLCFTVWDLDQPAKSENLVLLTRDEAEAHEKGGGKLMYPEEVRSRIERKLKAHAQWTAHFRS